MALKSFGSCTLNDNWFEERAPPLKGVMADYGVRSYETSTKSDFKSKTHYTGRSRAHRQKLRAEGRSENDALNDLVAKYTSNIGIEQHGAGFGAILPSHTAGYEDRHLTTSNHGNFGVGKKMSNTKKRFMKGPNAPSGGGPAGAREEKGMSTSGMAGEVFKTSAEPQQNTEAQRRPEPFAGPES